MCDAIMPASSISPMPNPSTPMLLLIVCSPVTFSRTSAASRFSGIPLSPKPPIIIVETEAISATASSADATTLFIVRILAGRIAHTPLLSLLRVRRKGKGRHAMARLTRLQLSRRKGRMVRRVGIMLRLQAQRGVPLIPFLRLAIRCSIQRVARVKLPPRLSRGHRHHATARRVVYASRCLHFAILSAQHPVDVIPSGDLHLLVVLVNTLANHGRLAKIERRSLHRSKHPCRNLRGIHRRVEIRRNHHLLVENRSL